MSSTLQPGPDTATVSAADSLVKVATDGSWSEEIGAIEATLAEQFGPGLTGEYLPPPPSHATLRSRIREAAPKLAALTDEIAQRFADGAGGIFIPQLGLGALEVDHKRKGVYSLAALLGDVTETEPVDHRVLWDIQAKQEELREYSKFSQADGEAQYHTDSTIVPVPERYFLLYAVRQAECGGGVSIFHDGRVLKHRLEQTPQGRQAIATLLNKKLPLRIPKAFREKYGVTAKDGYSYVSVLSDSKPMWRWRKDKIEQGLVKHPEYATAEVREALDAVAEQLADPADEIRTVVPTDGIVIIDNHFAFHGRTSFTDVGRHLLRIRFNEIASNEIA